MKNIRYVSNVLFMLLIIGTILLLADIKSVSAGYGFNLFGLLGILIINVLFVSKENINASLFTLVKKILFNNVSIVALVGVTAWLLAQNIIHQKKIIEKKTPKEYNRFLNTSTILNIFLFTMLYIFMNDKYRRILNTSQEQPIDNPTYTILYVLLLSVQYCLALFQHIILNYYSTDG
jgi:hypothetical protein